MNFKWTPTPIKISFTVCKLGLQTSTWQTAKETSFSVWLINTIQEVTTFNWILMEISCTHLMKHTNARTKLTFSAPCLLSSWQSNFIATILSHRFTCKSRKTTGFPLPNSNCSYLQECRKNKWVSNRDCSKWELIELEVFIFKCGQQRVTSYW